MMIYKTFLSAVLMASLTNCNANKNMSADSDKAKVETSAPSNNQKNTVYLNEGENKFLTEYQMNVTFKSISEDSRCPEGVQCVWAGIAVANVELMSTTSRPMTVQIATSDLKSKNLSKKVMFNGYEISLVQVSPNPTETKTAATLKGKYKIGLTFKKV
jgi:hypothetical protein